MARALLVHAIFRHQGQSALLLLEEGPPVFRKDLGLSTGVEAVLVRCSTATPSTVAPTAAERGIGDVEGDGPDEIPIVDVLREVHTKVVHGLCLAHTTHVVLALAVHEVHKVPEVLVVRGARAIDPHRQGDLQGHVGPLAPDGPEVGGLADTQPWALDNRT